jgi:hypothetical protein
MANTESADAATSSSSTTVSFTSSAALTSFTTAYMCSLAVRAVTATAISRDALHNGSQCDDSVHGAQRKRQRLAAARFECAIPTADAALATIGAATEVAAVATVDGLTQHCSLSALRTTTAANQQQQQQQPAHITSSNSSSSYSSSNLMPLTQQAFARWCTSGSSPCDFDNIVGLLCEDVSTQQYMPLHASNSCHIYKLSCSRKHVH